MRNTRTGSKRTPITAACAAALLLFAIGHASAQSFISLQSFGGTDGNYPSPLVQASDGNFYGVTNGLNDNGTVFRMTPNGAVTTLHIFSGPDGAHPSSRLVLASDGNLYGVTYLGGSYLDGTIFRITTGGTFTTLHVFSGLDGSHPSGGLIQGSDGALYGVTDRGGAYSAVFVDDGTVFRITTGGALTVLHSFNANNLVTYADGSIHPEGATPVGALVQATGGSLYGVTEAGGDGIDAYGQYAIGTVYRITTSGSLTELHNFGGLDGAYPLGGLIQASNGGLYGTSSTGGTGTDAYGDSGLGTVFQITTTGAFTSLYSFSTDSTGYAFPNGYNPVGELLQATDGDLYGTTDEGGLQGFGAIFRITTTSALHTLHSFTGIDGASPAGGLIQATDGNIYGTTTDGGTGYPDTLFNGALVGQGTAFVLALQAPSSPDATPPSTTASFSGPLGSNGWYVGPVSVSLSAVDNSGGSGVAATNYRVDGGAWQRYAAPFTISGDAVHSLVYWSVDNAGNAEAQQSATVSIDGTGPSVSAQTTPSSVKASGKQIQVTVSGAVTDAISGVNLASGHYSITDSAGGSVPGGAFGISTTESYSFTLSLLASTPQGTTRTYTIRVYANDRAGNPGSTSTTLTVKG